nr:4'-phosphopantetheinyl transferase superfamily protein [Streptomyces taklimakanensis]
MPAAGRLDVWLIRRPSLDIAWDVLDPSDLSDAERKRAASFVRPRDAVTYLSAHIALRRLLGAYLRVPPREVAFVREPCPGCAEPHGRPAVAFPSPPLHFSLAHSHGMAAVAVSTAVVGVDVERLPRDETVEVCTPALHPGERAELESAPPEGRRELFGRIWTRKEAYLKALGTGLSRDPALDYLGTDPGRRPPGWTVLDVPCGPRHNAAVVVRGDSPVRPVVRRLPEEFLRARGATGSAPSPTARTSHCSSSGA